MKKLLTIVIAAAIMLTACFSLTACSPKLKYVGMEDQLAALTEVKSGTSDIAVIDSVMAGYYVNKPNFSDLQVLEGAEFTFSNEFYAIGCRKGGNTDEIITAVLYHLQQAGTIATIAAKYGLTDVICTINAPAKSYETLLSELDVNSDFGKIKTEGKLYLGYTIFEPIAYEENDVLVGYDIELAAAVCEVLELQLVNVKINWNTKEDELNSENIDVIWNGFTYTDQRAENIDFTDFYMSNRQAIVIRKADATKYVDYASMKDADFVAESESAGETTIQTIIKNKIFG